MKNTKDKTIREALINKLTEDLILEQAKNNHPARIFSEFGVNHGKARIDIAVVNGIIHGYEIKSDADTLERLPEQCTAYNQVFDKITLVVGEKHIIDALQTIPIWWGVILAKEHENGKVKLGNIREPLKNPYQNKVAIARLLWKQEAIEILESKNKAKGVKGKYREFAYQRLASETSQEELKEIVNDKLFSRLDWRVDQQLLQCGD